MASSPTASKATWTIAGAAVVVASGLYLFHRERAIAKRVFPA